MRVCCISTRVRNHIDGEDKLGSNVQQLMSTDVQDDEKRQSVVFGLRNSLTTTTTTTMVILPMQRNFMCAHVFEMMHLNRVK